MSGRLEFEGTIGRPPAASLTGMRITLDPSDGSASAGSRRWRRRPAIRMRTGSSRPTACRRAATCCASARLPAGMVLKSADLPEPRHRRPAARARLEGRQRRRHHVHGSVRRACRARCAARTGLTRRRSCSCIRSTATPGRRAARSRRMRTGARGERTGPTRSRHCPAASTTSSRSRRMASATGRIRRSCDRCSRGRADDPFAGRRAEKRSTSRRRWCDENSAPRTSRIAPRASADRADWRRPRRWPARRRATRAGRSRGTAVLSGIVVSDDAEARPVRKARVTCSSPNVSGNTTITDDGGRFVFAGLPAGRLHASARRSRHGWRRTTARRGRMRPDPPCRSPTARSWTSSIRMARGSVITGVVLDRQQPAGGRHRRCGRCGSAIVNGERRLVVGRRPHPRTIAASIASSVSRRATIVVGATGLGTAGPASSALTSDADVRHATAAERANTSPTGPQRLHRHDLLPGQPDGLAGGTGVAARRRRA